MVQTFLQHSVHHTIVSCFSAELRYYWHSLFYLSFPLERPAAEVSPRNTAKVSPRNTPDFCTAICPLPFTTATSGLCLYINRKARNHRAFPLIPPISAIHPPTMKAAFSIIVFSNSATPNPNAPGTGTRWVTGSVLASAVTLCSLLTQPFF